MVDSKTRAEGLHQKNKNVLRVWDQTEYGGGTHSRRWITKENELGSVICAYTGDTKLRIVQKQDLSVTVSSDLPWSKRIELSVAEANKTLGPMKK